MNMMERPADPLEDPDSACRASLSASPQPSHSGLALLTMR